MAGAPASLFIPPPLPPPLPPFPPDSPSDDLSPLGLVLGFIAIITILVLIYTIVFGIKCPSPPLGRSHRSSGSYSVEISSVDGGGGVMAPPEVNQEKESGRVADAVGGECPVCLSRLSEGEEIKLLSVCAHAFHNACIDKWLESHSNCPVCRASIAVKRPNNPAPTPPPPPTAAREVFRHQGFQHAADLV